MIQSNKQADSFNRKRKQIVFLALASTILVAIIVIVMSVLKVESVYITLVSFFLLIALLIVIFILKPRAMYYSMHYRYQTLLANSIRPYAIKENFDMAWIEKILRYKFQYGAKHDGFDVLYRISKPAERSAFNTNKVLEIIAVIKDNDLDFYSDAINDDYKRIWTECQEQHGISKQVIIQFKKYDQYSETIKEDLDRIISFREGSNYLITINCGYFEKENQIYFLHSDHYFPNLYYKYAVDLIKTLTE